MQCPARVGFGQTRSASEKNDLRSRSRSESEMKKLRDREVKFLENLKKFPGVHWGVLHPPRMVNFSIKLGVKFHSFH